MRPTSRHNLLAQRRCADGFRNSPVARRRHFRWSGENNAQAIRAESARTVLFKTVQARPETNRACVRASVPTDRQVKLRNVATANCSMAAFSNLGLPA